MFPKANVENVYDLRKGKDWKNVPAAKSSEYRLKYADLCQNGNAAVNNESCSSEARYCKKKKCINNLKMCYSLFTR